MVSNISRPSTVLVALFALVAQLNAAPLRHPHGGRSKHVGEVSAWGSGPLREHIGPPNWPYIPSWPSPSGGAPAPPSYPTGTPWSPPTGTPNPPSDTSVPLPTFTVPTQTIIGTHPHSHTKHHTEVQPTTVTSQLTLPTTPTTPVVPPTSINTTPGVPESSSILSTPTPSQTTLSTSIVAPTNFPTPTIPTAPTGQLSMAVVNSLGSSNVFAYLTGVDTSGQLVMLTTDGSFYTPSTGSATPEVITANVALPLGAGYNQFVIPDYISSARLWFSEGPLQFSAVATTYGVGLVEPTVTNVNDPSEDVYWGFVELTYNAEYGLFANLSFVDFVGIGVGMALTTTNSGPQSAPGMPGTGVSEVCDKLKAQAQQDGQPWDQLCESDSNGNLIRVLSPGSYLSINPNAFSGYFDDYVNQVWEKYTSQPLYIESQNYLGQISCQVSGDILNCNGDSRGYAKPTSQDIFSCSTGTFAIWASDNDVHLAVVPRLCAAFNRATLLLENGNVQPKVKPNKYYTVTPNNAYSQMVHEVEIDGEGYAFPYDDVAPDYQFDVAGIVAASDPAVLTVTIGG